MAGAAIGALLGTAFGSTLAGWGLVASAGTGWLFGAAIGSLFDQPSMDFGSSSPNYSFGPIHNSKSQLLPVPVCYGRVRVAGNVFMQKFYDDKKQKMDMFVGLGQGPINRVISVYANEHVLYGDGSDTYTYHKLVGKEWEECTYAEYQAWEGTKEIRDKDGNPATVDLKECSCDIHLGEANQTKDDREPGEYTYPRVAYLGLTLKVQQGLSGNPTITSEVEGRKVWTPAGIRYTNNPIWCVVDVLTDDHYGVGLPRELIDIPSCQEAAAYCDELVDGKPRYTLNYIIDRQRSAPDILRDMLMCCNGYFLEREKIELHVARPVSAPSKVIDLDESAIQGSFSWSQKSREEHLNRVVVEWVDPENHYERTSTPFEDQADIIARGVRERNISLLGVTDPAQAARLGEQALHMGQDINNVCSFGVSVQDWDMEPGDVIAITEKSLTGWNRKWFHVADIEEDFDAEEATVTCMEYSPSSFVNTPNYIPGGEGDNGETPVELDNYENLLLTDEGHQNGDGTYVPKIRVRFTPPSAEMKEHVVSYWHDDQGRQEKKISPKVKDALISEGIKTGKVLTVHVHGTDLKGKPRTGVIGQIVPGRDTVAPSPPTNLTTTGWFGDVILDWVNPTTNEDGTPCTDLAYIEIWECTEDDVTKAVKVGEVNGTHFERHLGSFDGRYFWVRAVDTSGNMSQWNALAGTYGYSDQASHEDFINELLEQNPLIQELWNHLEEEVDGLAEGRIKDLLSSLDQFYADLFRQRQIDKQAEAQIKDMLSEYEDMKHSLAIVNEEKTIREEQDLALAQHIKRVAAMLGDPENPAEDTLWAGIYKEQTARVTRDEALAKEMTDISAGIGDPSNPEAGTVFAAIREEKQARVTKDEAHSQELATLYAKAGENSAAIQTETEARAGADSSLAQTIQTVQGMVGQNVTKIQEQMRVLDGIKGEWTVKIDNNGAVAGIGLINGPKGSSFIVRADSFWVGKSGTSIKEAPFVIGTVDGIQRVSMSNAFIQDASISAAKIQDLTVGRIKLISGVKAGLSYGDSVFDPGGGKIKKQGSKMAGKRVHAFSTEAGRSRTLIIGSISVRHWHAHYAVRLYRNGNKLLGTFGTGGGGAYDPYQTRVIHYLDASAPSGTNSYEIRVSMTDNGEEIMWQETGLTAITIYR